MSRRISGRYGPFRWYHEKESHQLGAHECERAAEVGMMLLLENIKSVSFRYPRDKSSATLPGPVGGEAISRSDFARVAHFSPEPVQVLKSVSCLRYQSCEHPEWETSEAYAFLESLEQSAINALPGYEEAAWGAPEAVRAIAKGKPDQWEPPFRLSS